MAHALDPAAVGEQGRRTDAASCCGSRSRKKLFDSLAFLAPDLVKAAIDGRLPHGMGVARLADLPAEWSRQLPAEAGKIVG